MIRTSCPFRNWALDWRGWQQHTRKKAVVPITLLHQELAKGAVYITSLHRKLCCRHTGLDRTLARRQLDWEEQEQHRPRIDLPLKLVFPHRRYECRSLWLKLPDLLVPVQESLRRRMSLLVAPRPRAEGRLLPLLLKLDRKWAR